MPIRYFSIIIFIIIIFYAVRLRAENPIENRQPSITRNPFVSSPYGRMSKTPPGTENNTDSGRIKKDIADVPLKSLRLRGVLISNDKAVALLSHNIVEIGDIIEDYTVTDIADNGVTLSKGDIVIRLTIE
jgi:Tfp pilus assembly protein PilP